MPEPTAPTPSHQPSVLTDIALPVLEECRRAKNDRRLLICRSHYLDWTCNEETQASCIADFYAFIEKAKAYRRPTTAAAIRAEIIDQQSRPEPVIPPVTLSGQQLREAILDALNVRFLFDKGARRPLRTTVYRQQTGDTFELTTMLFEDPLLGKFRVLVSRPRGYGPFPAIIAAHGHAQAPRDFIVELADKGLPLDRFIVALPQFRAMYGWPWEGEISQALLVKGFSLIGLQMAETMQVHRYLLTMPEVDKEQIGLLGHSSGSTMGNVLIRVTDVFSAHVSDNATSYYDMIDDGTFTSSTAPGLWPLRHVINDFSTSPTPVMQAEYNYPNGLDDAVIFLLSHRKSKQQTR